MAYEKTNWASTTPINPTNLNKLENGIEQNSNDIETNNTDLNAKIGELSALDTTEKSNLVGAINELNTKHTYSTEERVIGTYVDGKPLYEKCISGAYASGMALITDVDTLVRCDGSVALSGVRRLIPYYELYEGKTYCATVNVNSSNKLVTNYVLANETVSAGATTNLIVEYTKTTDTAE